MLNFYDYHNQPLDSYDKYYEILSVAYNMRMYDIDFTPIIKVIRSDARLAYLHARYKLNERSHEVEPLIATHTYYTFAYAKYVIKGRWLEQEPDILANHYAFDYAKEIVCKRWEEFEKLLIEQNNTTLMYYYARDIIRGRFKKFEPYIMKNGINAGYYAAEIIKGRWLDAEPYIKQSDKNWKQYVKNVESVLC